MRTVVQYWSLFVSNFRSNAPWKSAAMYGRRRRALIRLPGIQFPARGTMTVAVPVQMARRSAGRTSFQVVIALSCAAIGRSSKHAVMVRGSLCFVKSTQMDRALGLFFNNMNFTTHKTITRTKMRDGMILHMITHSGMCNDSSIAVLERAFTLSSI